MKILFTSVGRRVELMQAFRSAAESLCVPLEIWGADMTDSAPALLYCDKTIKVCRISSPEYIPLLLEICEKENIDALVPTIDTDLLILSQNKEKFATIGTKVIVSDEDKIKICRDKRYTADYFISVGLKSPIPVDDYLKYDRGYPAFIKPKDGSSSIFAYKVNNFEELENYAKQVPDYIIQPFIEGTEYTVDVFCDFSGNPIYITPRIRLAVRAGEVLKTEICNDENIISEVKQLLRDYKPCGAITIQLIKQKETNDNYYIEINPRFGGGAPITMKAGADSAKALLSLLMGEALTYNENAAIDKAHYSRYDQTVCVKSKSGKIKAVIFDLDDTLYSEKDYVRSGYKAVASYLSRDDIYEKLCNAFEMGKTPIDYVLQSEGIYSDELKCRCVEIYRKHIPNIKLYDNVLELIENLQKNNIKIGIITDGRSNGQRNKIAALGLENVVDEIIITDELGGPKFRKPNDISFRIMQCKMGIPFGNMVYVGDNCNKDFKAPRQLGMQTIYMVNKDGLYYTGDFYDCNKVYSIKDLEDMLVKGL